MKKYLKDSCFLVSTKYFFFKYFMKKLILIERLSGRLGAADMNGLIPILPVAYLVKTIWCIKA